MSSVEIATRFDKINETVARAPVAVEMLTCRHVERWNAETRVSALLTILNFSDVRTSEIVLDCNDLCWSDCCSVPTKNNSTKDLPVLRSFYSVWSYHSSLISSFSNLHSEYLFRSCAFHSHIIMFDSVTFVAVLLLYTQYVRRSILLFSRYHCLLRIIVCYLTVFTARC